MKKCFESLKDHPHVSDVRQRGMVLAIELIKDKKRRIPYNWKEKGHKSISSWFKK